jgi:signal transduction histidine kinase/CheY-like chemotaxis protein
MQFFYDYPLIAVLSCCAVLLMLGLTLTVCRRKNMFPFLVISWFILFGILIAGVYSVNHVAQVAKDGLQNSLAGLAKSFAVALKDAGHESVTLETPDDDPLYRKLLDTMFAWQSEISSAASIYTFRKNEKGEIIFICCPPADLNRDGKIEGEKEKLTPKGTIYDDFDSEEDIAEILDAFGGTSGFNYVPVEDTWGLWITATEPISSVDGERVDAVLGVDFWGEDWNIYVERAVFWPQLFLLSAVILFFAVQFFVIRQHIIEDRLTEYAATLERVMDELVAAKKDADAATQAKSFFLANISHEIRTPLNAILGSADLLVRIDEGKPMQISREQLVDMMQKNSKNLTTLIDDVLTFSSIDMNRIVLQSVPVNLQLLLEDIKAAERRALAEKPDVEFMIEHETSVPKVILGDPVRLRQILLCLVGNGIKFTRAGHVAVRCSMAQVSDSVEQSKTMPVEPPLLSHVTFLHPQIAHAKGLRGVSHITELVGQQTASHQLPPSGTLQDLSYDALVLRIDVSDTGIGIAREQFDTLFKPFSQVDGTSTRQFGGTGLGLSIAKGLVQLMGGTIQVKSELGHGSMFSVFIPVEEYVDPKIKSPAPPKCVPQESGVVPSDKSLPLHGYNILVVDDVVVNRIVVETKLLEMGAKVQGAKNGRIAVDLVLESEQAKEPFDFILMDLQMPIMDGFEATRTLRQWGFKKPIVALTANHDSNEQALAVGCNKVLLKPADAHILLHTITELS